MQRGDFTTLAECYGKYRPGYNQSIIEEIIEITNLNASDIRAADVGAGTGIFSKQLIQAGVGFVTAIEPNEEMRKVGKLQNHRDLSWNEGSAENTNLQKSSVDLLTMASSFHWANTEVALEEFNRVLKPGGIFAAIWNPRITELSETERKVQFMLENDFGLTSRVSSGRSGITDNLNEILINSGLFENVKYVDKLDVKERSPGEYLGAWRSVNDVQAQLGPKRFDEFIDAVEKIVRNLNAIEVHYLTRAWIATSTKLV